MYGSLLYAVTQNTKSRSWKSQTTKYSTITFLYIVSSNFLIHGPFNTQLKNESRLSINLGFTAKSFFCTNFLYWKCQNKLYCQDNHCGVHSTWKLLVTPNTDLTLPRSTLPYSQHRVGTLNTSYYFINLYMSPHHASGIEGTIGKGRHQCCWWTRHWQSGPQHREDTPQQREDLNIKLM